jgi:ribonuclease Z
MALRHNSDVYLFDCGESTQIQILRKSSLRASRIKKIFITHMHGDHSFGLPGVLCLIGLANSGQIASDSSNESSGDAAAPIDIFGPPGLRVMLRAVMRLTHSRVTVPYRVHEIHGLPPAGQQYQTGKGISAGGLPMNPSAGMTIPFDTQQHFGELPGGRDIAPSSDGTFCVFEDSTVVIHAAPMKHTVPCVGYVFAEKSKKGTLRVTEELTDIIRRNKDALSLLPEFHIDPLHVYRRLKLLQPHEEYRFPDGSIVTGRDILSDPIVGRKVVFMGDTSSGNVLYCSALFMNFHCTIDLSQRLNCYQVEKQVSTYSAYSFVTFILLHFIRYFRQKHRASKCQCGYCCARSN